MVLLASAAGWRLGEVAVAYRARTGRSKVTGTVRGTAQAAAGHGPGAAMSLSSSGPAPLHVLVMAKAPVAGKVKTRLCPPCSPQEAAAVAEAALADTLEAVAGCGAEVKVVALDGSPGRWMPAGLRVIAQRGASFAARLANAWAETRPWTGGWGIQIGMDTPQVTAGELDDLLEVLRDRDPDCPAGPPPCSAWPATGGGGSSACPAPTPQPSSGECP